MQSFPAKVISGFSLIQSGFKFICKSVERLSFIFVENVLLHLILPRIYIISFINQREKNRKYLYMIFPKFDYYMHNTFIVQIYNNFKAVVCFFLMILSYAILMCMLSIVSCIYFILLFLYYIPINFISLDTVDFTKCDPMLLSETDDVVNKGVLNTQCIKYHDVIYIPPYCTKFVLST